MNKTTLVTLVVLAGALVGLWLFMQRGTAKARSSETVGADVLSRAQLGSDGSFY